MYVLTETQSIINAAGTSAQIHTHRYESALSAQSAGDLCLMSDFWLSDLFSHKGTKAQREEEGYGVDISKEEENRISFFKPL